MIEALDSVEAFQDACGADPTGQLERLRELVTQSLAFQDRIGATPPWVGYLAVREREGDVIGCCGFKGDPDDAGTVEIAYYTFPDHEGRGLATAMAAELVAIARTDARARRVIAHTLPEPNASTRVLAKNGFAFAGDVVDPEDGPVWRFALDLGGAGRSRR